MYLVCYSDYGRRFEILLINNGDVMDKKTYQRNRRIYGKIKCKNDEIYFDYDEYSFMKICDGKLVDSKSKILYGSRRIDRLAIGSYNLSVCGQYLHKGKKKIKFRNVEDHVCRLMANLGDFLICVFDYESGYSERPDTKIFLIDTKKLSIINHIELGCYNGEQCSYFHHGDKLFLCIDSFDNEICPSSDEIYLLTLNKEGKFTETYLKARLSNDDDAQLAVHKNILCFGNSEKIIFENITDGEIEEVKYFTNLTDRYVHSFLRLD